MITSRVVNVELNCGTCLVRCWVTRTILIKEEQKVLSCQGERSGIKTSEVLFIFLCKRQKHAGVFHSNGPNISSVFIVQSEFTLQNGR